MDRSRRSASVDSLGRHRRPRGSNRYGGGSRRHSPSRSRSRSRSHSPSPRRSRRRSRSRSRDRASRRRRSPSRSRSRSPSRSRRAGGARGATDERARSNGHRSEKSAARQQPHQQEEAEEEEEEEEPQVANALAHLTEEEQMQALMGFGGFDSTKGKPVEDNVKGAATGALRKEKKRQYRQYMNRRGGFNRPLENTK